MCNTVKSPTFLCKRHWRCMWWRDFWRQLQARGYLWYTLRRNAEEEIPYGVCGDRDEPHRVMVWSDIFLLFCFFYREKDYYHKHWIVNSILIQTSLSQCLILVKGWSNICSSITSCRWQGLCSTKLNSFGYYLEAYLGSTFHQPEWWGIYFLCSHNNHIIVYN